MISATQMRPGMVIKYNNELYTIFSVSHRTPGNLPGFVQAKMRSIRTGSMTENRFSSEDKVEKAIMEEQEMEYLYDDGEYYYFMNTETYEQMHLMKDLLGDAVAIHRGREPAINGDLTQNGGKLLRGKSVAQCATEMRLELVHPAEAGNHAKIEDAALAWLEGVIAPHRTPAVSGEQLLELPVEVVRIGNGTVHVFVPEHLPAHCHSTVVQCLVHRRTSRTVLIVSRIPHVDRT